MKKSLIALAVLAASGVASAQSTVTIYGLVDAYVGAVKSNNLRQTVMNSGGFNTSRFGFKGTEDLGGGLKANFVLENGFNVDTGATPNSGPTNQSIFSGQSWVGLSGGFGEVRLGKMWTPFDEVKGSGAAAFDANIFAPASNVWVSNNYNDRPGNSIYYATPNFSGFSAAALYAFGENKTNAVGITPAQDAGKTASVNVQYANGPIGVALSHQQEKANGNAVSTKYNQLNGSYDLGVAKILAAYGNVKVSGDKTNEYQIGVDVPLGGALTVSGGVAASKTKFGAAATPESKSTGFGLAAKYELSKRTFLYTGLQAAKTKVANSADVKTDTFAVGVQHKF
ncbi:MAG: porin [Polaromonas sp.]|nr:porin [Polaromonas sp.]